MRDGTESIVEATRAWLEIDGVEEIAEGRDAGEPCVLVFASSAPEALRRRLPNRVFGLRVVIRCYSCVGRASIQLFPPPSEGSSPSELPGPTRWADRRRRRSPSRPRAHPEASTRIFRWR